MYNINMRRLCISINFGLAAPLAGCFQVARKVPRIATGTSQGLEGPSQRLAILLANRLARFIAPKRDDGDVRPGRQSCADRRRGPSGVSLEQRAQLYPCSAAQLAATPELGKIGQIFCFLAGARRAEDRRRCVRGSDPTSARQREPPREKPPPHGTNRPLWAV